MPLGRGWLFKPEIMFEPAEDPFDQAGQPLSNLPLHKGHKPNVHESELALSQASPGLRAVDRVRRELRAVGVEESVQQTGGDLLLLARSVGSLIPPLKAVSMTDEDDWRAQAPAGEHGCCGVTIPPQNRDAGRADIGRFVCEGGKWNDLLPRRPWHAKAVVWFDQTPGIATLPLQV